MEVVTFKGEKYYFEKSKTEKITEMIEKNKFIAFPRYDAIIATSSIEKIQPAKQDVNILETMLANELDESIKQKVRHFVSLREAEKISKPLTEGVIENMIKKAKGIE